MFVLQRVVLRTRISKERPINTCMPYVPSFSGCGPIKGNFEQWEHPYRPWRSKLCILAGPSKVYRIWNASERCIESARRKDKKMDLRLFEEYMWYFRASPVLVYCRGLSSGGVERVSTRQYRESGYALWILSLIIHRRRNWGT